MADSALDAHRARQNAVTLLTLIHQRRPPQEIGSFIATLDAEQTARLALVLAHWTLDGLELVFRDEEAVAHCIRTTGLRVARMEIQ